VDGKERVSAILRSERMEAKKENEMRDRLRKRKWDSLKRKKQIR
jgi:hypothetical protein